MKTSVYEGGRGRFVRATATLAAAGILTAGLGMDARPAQAAEADPDIFSAISKAYGVMFSGLNLLARPDRTVQIEAARVIAEVKRAEAKILATMKDQFFFQQQQGFNTYRGRVQAVFDRYRDMSTMATNHPDLAPLRNATQIEGELLLADFGETVRSNIDASRDAVLSYELATAFNVLLPVHLNVLKMRSEMTPATPMPISFFQTQLRRGIEVDYRLIGAQEQACGGTTYPPFRDNYFVGTRLDGRVGQLQAPIIFRTFKQSKLYTQKFSNRWRKQGDFECNLKTRMCMAAAFYAGGNGGLPQSCDNPRHPSLKPVFASCLAQADINTVPSAFNGDATVKLIRLTMQKIMSLGLVGKPTPIGTLPGPDPALGAYSDPWVVDSHCGHNGRGRDYIIYP